MERQLRVFILRGSSARRLSTSVIHLDDRESGWFDVDRITIEPIRPLGCREELLMVNPLLAGTLPAWLALQLLSA